MIFTHKTKHKIEDFIIEKDSSTGKVTLNVTRRPSEWSLDFLEKKPDHMKEFARDLIDLIVDKINLSYDITSFISSCNLSEVTTGGLDKKTKKKSVQNVDSTKSASNNPRVGSSKESIEK